MNQHSEPSVDTDEQTIYDYDDMNQKRRTRTRARARAPRARAHHTPRTHRSTTVRVDTMQRRVVVETVRRRRRRRRRLFGSVHSHHDHTPPTIGSLCRGAVPLLRLIINTKRTRVIYVPVVYTVYTTITT